MQGYMLQLEPEEALPRVVHAGENGRELLRIGEAAVSAKKPKVAHLTTSLFSTKSSPMVWTRAH